MPIQPKDLSLLGDLFPKELSTYFSITDYQILCEIETKSEFWLIDFKEKNDLPRASTSLPFNKAMFPQNPIARIYNSEPSNFLV